MFTDSYKELYCWRYVIWTGCPAKIDPRRSRGRAVRFGFFSHGFFVFHFCLAMSR